MLSESSISKRVAIVGAGAAGITAAIRLHDLGYSPTVFEASSRVGGKVLTIKKEAHLFELGAIWIGDKYSEILDLANRVNHSIEVDQGLRRPEFIFTGPQGFYRLTLFKKICYVFDYYRFSVNAFFRRKALAHSNIATFYSLKKFPTLKSVMGSVWSGLGYGYLDEVSVRYFPYFFEISKSYLSPFTKQLAYQSTQGMSNLWECLAKDLDVRLNHEVNQIAFLDDGKLKINEDEAKYDALIFACPPDQAKKVIPSRLDDYIFLNQFNYIHYHSFLTKASPFPSQLGYFPAWAEDANKRNSYPLCWFQPYKDDPYVLIYSISEEGTPLEEIEECIKIVLAKMGITIKNFEEKKSWKYFPHFSTNLVDAGIFEDIEALQGVNNIYWTGEYLSFATIEHSARHAADLVRKYF